MKIIRYIALVLVTLTLASCSTSKQSPIVSGGNMMTNRDLPTLYADLTSSYGDWQYLSVPLKIDLRQPKNFSISGRGYMVKDMSVFISLRFIGMEMATIYVTNDSIYASDKVHKWYIAESLPSILAGYDFTVTDLQDLLLGRAFAVGQGTLTPADVKSVSLRALGDKSMWTITPKPIKGIDYAFDIDGRDNSVAALNVTATGYQTVSCRYAKPTLTPSGPMSKVASIEAMAGKTAIELSLQWSLDNARWNGGDMRQWSQPRGYTRLNRNDIVKMITSF